MNVVGQAQSAVNNAQSVISDATVGQAQNAYKKISDWDWSHADDLLSYSTAKVVVIRDRRLGCLYYTITFIIIAYIVVFQILFLNQHYPLKDVTGTSRVIIQQPTKNDCDPNVKGCESDYLTLEQIPYCREFIGKQTLRSTYRQPCVFADKHSIAPTGMLTNHLLVPTMVESTVENKGCEPSNANGHACTNEYEMNGEKTTVFVADIEHYTVLISHTFTRITQSGTSNTVQGYYLECDRSEEKETDAQRFIYGEKPYPCKGKLERKQIDCIRTDCTYMQTENGWNAFTNTVSKAKQIGSLMATRVAEMLRPRSSRNAKEHDQHNHTHSHGNGHRGLVRNEFVVAADGHIRQEHQHKRARARHAQSGAVALQVEEVQPSRLHAESSNQPESVLGIQSKEQEMDKAEAPNVAELKESGAWAVRKGDVFTIQKLLDLADLSLDETKNEEGKTLREAGTVIEIEVVYSNLHPWTSSFGNTEVQYEYRVQRRPVEDMADELYSQFQPNFPAQRALDHRHGLYIIVKISGQFGEFSLVSLLIMLCTAAGLLRMATYLVDYISVCCPFKRADVYSDAKYQLTDRVWEMHKAEQEAERSMALAAFSREEADNRTSTTSGEAG